jgi:hypothetical protein
MRTYTRVLGGIGVFILAAFVAACSVPMTGSGATEKSVIPAASSLTGATKDSVGPDASSPRSGPLHITKECSQDTGLAGGFCTITSSNLKAIKVGSRVVYASAQAADGSLNSDIIIYPPDNNKNLVFGHVDLPPNNGSGPVTLSGGTGVFTDFEARAVVSMLTADGINWAWDGWYSFGDKEDHASDHGDGRGGHDR